MKERPILFSAPMVQAILAGNKTQTRRVVKISTKTHGLSACLEPPVGKPSLNAALELCPYGKIGDQLWVRETWGVISYEMSSDGDLSDWTPDRPATPIQDMPFGKGYYSGHVIYRADGEFEFVDLDSGEENSRWYPSIHMPRLASRIRLEITGIRAERLQDCSVTDAIDEGIEFNLSDEPQDAIDRYRDLWEFINGAGSWDKNPWVWVIEFKRVNAATADGRE